VAFHHAALFSLAISTLTTALTKGFIPPLPGLTVTLLRKYTPHLEATAMCHMDNIRKNINCTKRVQFKGNPPQQEDVNGYPPPQSDNV
jgi:hypothetical protein